MSKVRLDEAVPGSVWLRDPTVHPTTEVFGCEMELSCVGNKRRDTNTKPITGPWLVMQCYAMVSGWWDEPIQKNDYGRVQENRDRGFCRWYYLVNYGWIHESNLFGFFKRVV